MKNRWSMLLALCAILPSPAISKDGWDGDGRPHVCDVRQLTTPQMEKCQQWIVGVMRPDYPMSSCCGDGDAFITDDYEVDKQGRLWAIFSENYFARPGYEGEIDIKKGDRILIPKDKLNNAAKNGGNPSGHGVTFIFPSTLERISAHVIQAEVICYLGPTGT